jgi:hypothetical protein
MADESGAAPEMSNELPGAAFGEPAGLTPFRTADEAAVAAELGRTPRGVLAVAFRCGHGVPAVLQTAPRLPDGTPFPTMFYLSCSGLTAAASRMESAGVMREMSERLASDPDLRQRYGLAHRAYLAVRNAVDDLGIAASAGGMPDRVKCLHALLGHALAAGPGVNPFGDEVVTLLPEYVKGRPCVQSDAGGRWVSSPAG